MSLADIDHARTTAFTDALKTHLTSSDGSVPQLTKSVRELFANSGIADQLEPDKAQHLIAQINSQLGTSQYRFKLTETTSPAKEGPYGDAQTAHRRAILLYDKNQLDATKGGIYEVDSSWTEFFSPNRCGGGIYSLSKPVYEFQQLQPGK